MPDPDTLPPGFADQFVDALPFVRALGMRLDTVGKGVAEMSMPHSPALVGDAATGVIHGGALSALLDTCAGLAVMAHPQSPFMTATLDLRIDYMRAATPGQRLHARAECYHLTRSVAFVRATATDDDTARPVATAVGAFALDHGGARKGDGA